jgi:hypothetical protein
MHVFVWFWECQRRFTMQDLRPSGSQTLEFISVGATVYMEVYIKSLHHLKHAARGNGVKKWHRTAASFCMIMHLHTGHCRSTLPHPRDGSGASAAFSTCHCPTFHISETIKCRERATIRDHWGRHCRSGECTDRGIGKQIPWMLPKAIWNLTKVCQCPRELLWRKCVNRCKVPYFCVITKFLELFEVFPHDALALLTAMANIILCTITALQFWESEILGSGPVLLSCVFNSSTLQYCAVWNGEMMQWIMKWNGHEKKQSWIIIRTSITRLYIPENILQYIKFWEELFTCFPWIWHGQHSTHDKYGGGGGAQTPKIEQWTQTDKKVTA